MQRKSSPLHRRYFAGAKSIMAGFKLAPLRELPADSLNGPSAEYEAMTVAGRLRIHVHDDWTHTQFDRTELMVGHYFHGANIHTGKWNFHTFLDQQKRGERTAGFVDDELLHMRNCLTGAKVAPFMSRPVVITTAEIEEAGDDAMRNRAAMGEDFIVKDFQKLAAAHWAYDTVKRGGDLDPEMMARWSYDGIANKSDLEAYITHRNWQKRVNAAGEIVA